MGNTILTAFLLSLLVLFIVRGIIFGTKKKDDDDDGGWGSIVKLYRALCFYFFHINWIAKTDIKTI